MKKNLFINPAYRTNLLDNVRVLALPPLNLMMLAAYTPDSYEVKIVDEVFEDIDFDAAVDLVAITCMTPLAPRAYAISREYRNRGAKVVLGGIHVSMVPDEAQLFADAIVVGEAEEVWPVLLRDFDNDRMQRRYQADTGPGLAMLRPPRRDLLRNRYFVQTMQTSRGCPHNCKFCSVTRFNGGQYRMRDIDMVVRELDSIPEKRLFIIDDNIIGSGKTCIRRALALFDAMRGCDKKWGGQTCLNIVENRESKPSWDCSAISCWQPKLLFWLHFFLFFPFSAPFLGIFRGSGSVQRCC